MISSYQDLGEEYVGTQSTPTEEVLAENFGVSHQWLAERCRALRERMAS